MERRSSRSFPPDRQLRAAAALVFLLLAQSSGFALAGTSPVVYHSPADDGTRPLAPLTVAPSPSEVLHLYMDESDGSADASPSNACGSGSGDERCGWKLTFDASGQVDFTSFTPSGDVIANLTTGAQARLICNGGNPTSGELGPVKLGDLEISSTGEGQVGLTAGAVVDSAQQKVTLAPDVVIHVPEPGSLSGLLPGLLALWAMQRWKARKNV